MVQQIARVVVDRLCAFERLVVPSSLGYPEHKVWTTLLARLADIDRLLAAPVRKLKKKWPKS